MEKVFLSPMDTNEIHDVLHQRSAIRNSKSTAKPIKETLQNNLFSICFKQLNDTVSYNLLEGALQSILTMKQKMILLNLNN